MARDYTPLPLEYLEEMDTLSDAEYGRLIRALQNYCLTGEEPKLSGTERLYWKRVRNREIKYREAFDEADRARSERGAKAAQARWNNAKACTGMHENAQACASIVSNAKHANIGDGDGDGDRDGDKKRETAHARGTYGWVKLTDGQYEKLVQDLGRDETERCIRYVDESAQATGNKNKWKDWYLTVRRCSRDGWGLRKGKTMTAADYAAAGPGKVDMEALQALAKRVGAID